MIENSNKMSESIMNNYRKLTNKEIPSTTPLSEKTDKKEETSTETPVSNA